MRRLAQHESTLSLFVILAAMVISYGLFIPRLGFYWDDWYFTWLGHSAGSTGIYNNLSGERVGTALQFAGSYAVLGDRPLLWHGWMFILRLLGGLFFWIGVRRLWPDQRVATTLMTLLFVLYPGYWQQSYALAEQNYLAAQALAMLSLTCTIYERRWLLGISLLAQAAYLMLIEGFIGMEGLRLLLLLYLMRPREALRRWSPYVLVTGGFLVYRLFFFQATRSDMDLGEIMRLYIDDPVGRALLVLYRLLLYGGNALVRAWTEAWYERLGALPVADRYLPFILAAVVCPLMWLYTRRSSAEKPEWARPVMLLGGLAALALLLPSVITIKAPELGSRYLFTATWGAAVVAVGGAYLIFPRRLAEMVLIVCVGASVVTQISMNQTLRRGWDDQRALWWQLAWRAPQFGPGTVLVIEAPTAWSDTPRNYEFSSAANFIYSYDDRAFRVDATQLDQSDVPFIESESWNQNTNFANTLILYRADEGCLRVIDGQRLYEVPATVSDLLQSVSVYSDTALILLDETPATPPGIIFGDEPAHEWCYHLQKAELARQRGDWPAVVELGMAAQEFSPRDAGEWLPFLEGAIQDGSEPQIRQWMGKLTERSVMWDEAVCKLLADAPAGLSDISAELQAELGCFDLFTIWGQVIEPGALVFYPAGTSTLPLDDRLEGLVMQPDLPAAAQMYIDDWRADKSAANLRAAGIDYLLIDHLWEQYATEADRAALASPDYEVVHRWHNDRLGQSYTLYRISDAE